MCCRTRIGRATGSWSTSSAASQKAFDAALAVQAQTTASTETTPKGDRLGLEDSAGAGQRFTVVIDPGHGGIDGGAEGLNGTVEKDITLAFARELQRQAAGRRALRRLHDARQATNSCASTTACASPASTRPTCSSRSTPTRSALKGIRGATVYTVSDKASDAEAQALADRENLSDQLAGIDVEDENQRGRRTSWST